MLTTLAERLRERLDALGLTDAELARRVGVKPPSVFLWLDGRTKNIRGANLLKAAAALRVHPGWLATGVGKKLLQDSADRDSRATDPYIDAAMPEVAALFESMTPAERNEALGALEEFIARRRAKR